MVICMTVRTTTRPSTTTAVSLAVATPRIAGLRRVDDGGEVIGVVAAEVADGEGAAGYILGPDLAGAGALDHGSIGVGDLVDVALVGLTVDYG